MLFSVSIGAKAQESSAMAGNITDASGAVIAGVSVTLSNPQTGVAFSQISDNTGSYRFANVPPQREYTVTFQHPGFATISLRHVALQVGITRTQDATLDAGAEQQVEVSGSSNQATLNTTDASIGNNLDVEVINDLPVQNRNTPAVLFSLQPGVVNNSVTGARTDQTAVTLDGMDVNDIAAGSGLGSTIVGNAPVDSVQEFRGVVAGLTPNLGTGSGGQFQIVTRTGTNRFHGDLNEYHRDTATSANSWFNNNTGVARPPLIRNQFGGALGGPVQKDKLFFFFDFNNSRVIQSANVERIVPLDSFRNGLLSYIRNTDSGTGNACTAASRQNSTPTCIGMLTPAQVQALDPQHIGESPALLAFLNANYPHANDPAYAQADGVNLGGFRFNFPEPDFLYNYVGRVDYNISPSQRVFARFTINRENASESANAFPSTTGTTNPFVDRSSGYVVSHIWQLGLNKVNQFYYGDTVQKYNFPSLLAPNGPTQYALGGASSTPTDLFGPFNSASSQKRRVPIPELRDDFNWQVHSHTIGFGGTFKFIKTNSQLVNDFNFVTLGLGGENLALDPSVRPTVANGYGGNAIRTAGVTSSADYDEAFALMLGRIASVSSNYNYNAAGTSTPQGEGETRRYRYFETELYAGDTWKVNRELTLSYGLRYQLYSVPYETSGEESIENATFNTYFNARRTQSASGMEGISAVPLITYSLGGKANTAAPLYQPSYKDFAPRLAFAFNPASLPKTVINGSFALIFDRTVINAVNFIQDQSSFLFQNSASTSYGNASTGAAGALGATNPRVGANLSYTNPNAPPALSRPLTPYVDNAQGSNPADPLGTPNSPFGLAANQYNSIIDPTLKDPYSLTYNLGVQQELADHFLLKLSYVGRLGRRLLAQADASQLVDFKDAASGQLLSQAFANLETEIRSGAEITPQPWIENQIFPGATRALPGSSFGPLLTIGDLADTIQGLQAAGLLNYNVGMASQFAEDTFLTNKGTSVYNGLLLTATRNFAQGLHFDVNYTWSHSMDNVSVPANYIASSQGRGFLCDATDPKECYANSDFDVQNAVNSDFLYELPFGRGKPFAANAPRLLQEAIGGWSLSAIPSWHSGYTLTAVSDAFVAGYSNNAPAIFNGNRADIGAHARKDPTTGAVYLFGSQAAANKAVADYSAPVGLTVGSRNNLRLPSALSMDAGLAKVFVVLPDERLNLRFRADFYNVLNHPVFGTQPTAPVGTVATDITSGSFGQISATASTARVGQFSLRLEF